MTSSEGEKYRHVKRGTVYEIIGTASLQVATHDVGEGSDLVLYRGEDGKLWAREKDEFHDGRFEKINSTTISTTERFREALTKIAAFKSVLECGDWADKIDRQGYNRAGNYAAAIAQKALADDKDNQDEVP